MSIDEHFTSMMKNFKAKKANCNNDKNKLNKLIREERMYLLQSHEILSKYYTNVELISTIGGTNSKYWGNEQ